MDATMLFVQPSQGMHATPDVLGVSTKAPPGNGAGGGFGQLLAQLLPQPANGTGAPPVTLPPLPAITVTAENIATALASPPAHEGESDATDVVPETKEDTSGAKDKTSEEAQTLVLPLLMIAIPVPATAQKIADNAIAGPGQGSDQQAGKTTTDAPALPVQGIKNASVAAPALPSLDVTGQTIGALADADLSLLGSDATTQQQTGTQAKLMAQGVPVPPLTLETPTPTSTLGIQAEATLAQDSGVTLSTPENASPVLDRKGTPVQDATAKPEPSKPSMTKSAFASMVPSDADRTSSRTNATMTEKSAPSAQRLPDDQAEGQATKPGTEQKEVSRSGDVRMPLMRAADDGVSLENTVSQKLQITPEMVSLTANTKETEQAKEKPAAKESARGESSKPAGESATGNASSTTAPAEKSLADGSLGKNAANTHQQPTLMKSDVAAPKDQSSFASTAFSLPPDVAKSVVDQVAKRLALQVQGETSEIRLTLKPESLGDVAVKIRMEDGKMQAQIDVGQVAVKAALESQLPQLRQALQNKGIDVQRIDVFAAGESASRDARHQQSETPRRRNGRHAAEVDPLEQYQTAKMFGYNTMEVII